MPKTRLKSLSPLKNILLRSNIEAFEAVDPAGMLVMDAKSLFDAIHNEQAGQDDARSALESSMIKEDLEKLGAIARWIPHDRNPTDALTKHEGAHSAPLYAVLRDHTWRLRHEEEEMAERAKARELTGNASSCPKQGWRDMKLHCRHAHQRTMPTAKLRTTECGSSNQLSAADQPLEQPLRSTGGHRPGTVVNVCARVCVFSSAVRVFCAVPVCVCVGVLRAATESGIAFRHFSL